jgi:hexokinase
MTGSMADVPKDLAEEINKLENLFTVEPSKLKEITNHFVSELAKGTIHAQRDSLRYELTRSRSQR